ncbi:hypothetical protein IQ07DRAFT_313545 [Pyrenochaeta sp. DS3sAY3a]|nr:hypothetical protein IQ07DRAFT_313545 [Pyrenochaeta sp. DS3sAY3a]
MSAEFLPWPSPSSATMSFSIWTAPSTSTLIRYPPNLPYTCYPGSQSMRRYSSAISPSPDLHIE